MKLTLYSIIIYVLFSFLLTFLLEIVKDFEYEVITIIKYCYTLPSLTIHKNSIVIEKIKHKIINNYKYTNIK